MGNKFNSFGDYGYAENVAFEAKTYEVSISENDKIISVTENGSLLATVKLGLDNQTLSLIGKDGKEFSSVVLPSASVVESARYDEEKQALILTIKLADGTTKEIEISFTDMLDDYAKKEDVEKNTQAIKDEATTRAEADAKFTEKDIEIENTISTLDDRLTAKDAEIDEALTKKVDLTELEYEGGIRKAIVLGNHDTILGTKASGGTVNIAMVSKWDKVDLGSKSVEINLNGSADRPTYNDSKQIALMDDIKGFATEEQLASKLNTETYNSDKATFATKEELAIKVDTSVYNEDKATFALKSELEGKVDESEISDMLTKTEASSVYQQKGNYLTEIPEEYVTNSELEESIKNKVEWSEFELNGDKRKSIVLGNYDTILGTTTSGGTVSIAMVSKWDVVDLGTTSLPINLNTPKGVRPTVQEAGQTGEEANKIAYLSEIIGLNATDNLLTSKIAVLEEKLEKLSKTAVENVELNGESEATFSDESKDYIISGEETKSTAITGKTVKLDNLSISNNARTTINASDVEIKNVNISGDFPKANGNAVVKVNDSEYVSVKDVTFNSEEIYNGIEIGLNSKSLPKSVLFENCQFLGKFTNNAILVFGTQDNAVVNINNCYFKDLSNAIRLSNNANKTCTLNITNCKFDKWDDKAPWQGMIIMEDYTSKSNEEAISNNLFGDNKITINIINCIGPNGKKITAPSDLSTICGTGDEKQIIYVYYDEGGLVAYDKSKYPIINIM